MMRKTIIIIFLLISTNHAFSQYILKNTEEVNRYSNIAQEQIFVHYNNSLLFTGENLYYKVYCLNAKTNQKTKFSKIAYVELVGKDGAVFKHKIKLKSGLNQGNYFIPTSVVTGNYKLIAYTQWMKNGIESHFFEADITIINPYSKFEFDDLSKLPENKYEPEANKHQQIKLLTDAATYGTREEVHLKIESLNASNANGSYSISIRKLNDIQSVFKLSTASTYKDSYSETWFSKKRNIGETIFLSEFRGEMIKGKVTFKDNGAPASNIQVALSILSKEAFQDVVLTNSDGVFNFQLKNDYSQSKAMVQVLGENRMTFILKVNDHESIDYSNLKFKELHLNPKYEQAIIERSVNNQIQNAYENVKKDNIIIPYYPKPFYGNHQTTYILDDYKRFPTVAETLTEVVDHAWHERKKGKQRYINVREREHDPYYGVDLLPMVVVDGAIVQDHESILYYDAKNVESISVLRDEYYYGKLIYQGVLLVNTFEGDYYKSMLGDYLQEVDLFTPNLKVSYFQQTYKNEKGSERIPDFRTQLLWLPDFEILKASQTIKFFTSDNRGTYQISLEGFNIDGQPISIKNFFKVE